ncbi:MAG: hypothetical protein ACNA8W_02125 [Bradymonadaceae bacterium]
MISRQRSAVYLISFIALILVMSTGCPREYDFERGVYDRGTIGHELFHIWRKDTARSAHQSQARVELLDSHYDEFVRAVDQAMPAESLGDVDRFFQESHVLSDEGYLPALTRKAEVILSEGAERRGLLAALSADYRPPIHSYVSPTSPANGASHVLRYPELPAVMADLGSLLVASDGLSDSGQPALGESSSYSDLLRELHHFASTFESAAPPDRLPMLLQDVLLVEDERFAMAAEATAPWYVTRFDERGFPAVRGTADGLVHPFVDSNGDGLADIDARGRYVFRDHEPRRVHAFGASDPSEPVFRDGRGRAYVVENQFVFDYVDLHRTALGYLVRAGAQLAEEDVLYHITEASSALLGSPSALEDERGLYVGYGAGPMAELAHALLDSLNLEDLPGFLEAMSNLLDHGSSALAGLMFALDHAVGVLSDHPEAGLAGDQTLAYDLLPIVAELVAHPELFHDVLDAFRQPITRRGAEPLLTLLRHKDPRSVPEPDGPYDGCFQDCRDRHRIGTEQRYNCIRNCPMGELFAMPMDIGGAESASNRSRLQSLFHLLRDTTGMPYTMLVEEARVPGITIPDGLPPMIYLPGAAEAFVRAVAGDLHLADYIPQEFNDSFLGAIIDLLNYILPGTIDNNTVAAVLSFASGLFGVHLDAYPTPDQITRLFNQEELKFEADGIYVAITDPVCHDGFVMAQHLADGLFAAEASGMIDILYPLARAFSAHDKPELLTEIFVVLHRHYSSRIDIYRDAHGEPSPMKGANLVSFELAMEEILEAGHIFEALHQLALATRGLKAADDVEVDEHLRRFLHRLTRTDDGFASRGGRETLELADGRVLEDISRLHVILHELDGVSRTFADDEEAQSHLSSAWHGLLGGVLETEESPAGGRRFADEGGVALTSHGLRVLATRARKYESRDELSRWLTGTLVDNMEEGLQSRGFFAAMTLAQDAFRSEDTRAHLRGLFTHLASSAEGANQSAAGLYLTLVRAMDTERWVPVGRFLTEMLDPDRNWATEPYGDLPLGSHLAVILKRAAELDPEGLGFALMARAVERVDGDAPMSVLGDLLVHYFRFQPGNNAPLDQNDYGRFFESMAEWLGDELHGMEQIYRIVETRRR